MNESFACLPFKITVVFWLWISFGQAFAQKVKVACIGDSVTFGFGISPKDSLSYPAQLQGMLGIEYLVKNIGKNGATLLRNGHNPSLKSEEFENALEFVTVIATIHLGLNDTDPRNWVARLKDIKHVGPYTLEIRSLEKRIIVDSPWIGDVWLAKGQSYKEWALENSNGGVEAPQVMANQAWLKVYKFQPKVPMNHVQWDDSVLQSLQTLDFFYANWVSGTGLKLTSGVGYFFGKTLQDNLQVPNGFDTKEIWYCFSPFPSPNLTENTGLPIPPFRWPLQDPGSL